MLILSEVPWLLKRDCQKLLIKFLSQSETIDLGKPCRHTTSRMKIDAIELAEKGWRSPIKCSYLLKWSTTTKIESIPLDSGRAEIHRNIIPYFSGMGSG